MKIKIKSKNILIVILFIYLLYILWNNYSMNNPINNYSMNNPINNYSMNNYPINNSMPIKTKRKVSETTKKYVASQQSWKCNICKGILNHTYEIDHIVPLYKGGTNQYTNLQALCRDCHANKTYTDRENKSIEPLKPLNIKPLEHFKPLEPLKPLKNQIGGSTKLLWDFIDFLRNNFIFK